MRCSIKHFSISLLVVVAACGGCKTAEFAVQHPLTGLHVVAKFAAEDQEQPQPLPAAHVSEPCVQHSAMQTTHRLPAAVGG